MAIEHSGKKSPSYKHPVFEYIMEKALQETEMPPDEIPITYEGIYEAMDALGRPRKAQSSRSNIVLDLLRQANKPEQRVPFSVWEQGYDLARAPKRQARQGIAGRLVKRELMRENPWIVWGDIGEENTVSVENKVPVKILLFLGNDEGALLSVIDYCDALSYAINKVADTVMRVQHPKKWQPGEVDGLYFSDYDGIPTLYPVEAKGLSTKDDVNLEQMEGSINTIIGKVPGVRIVPLAVQMTSEGMYLAIFEAAQEIDGDLTIAHRLKVKIDPLSRHGNLNRVRRKRSIPPDNDPDFVIECLL